ncbi:MAG: hypothetical protein FWH21_01000 [Kiritimatiellaeota bacterium]|nr:hypothetical protein [Kiritimatiellota bacterium]
MKMTKTRLGVVLSVFALMMCVGCVSVWDKKRNEVVYDLSRKPIYNSKIQVDSFGFNFEITCIEQTKGLNDNSVKVSDVCIASGFMLQTYRIQGNRIVNYHWSDYLLYGVRHLQEDDKKQTAWKECETLIDKMWAMRKAHEQLPNRLVQSETRPQRLGNSPVVTITAMREGLWIPSTPNSSTHWNNWAAWQWAGAPDEVPEAIEVFRQSAVQVASVPKYVKSHLAYLRAIPLFTEEELEVEKDTPLIDLQEARYHIRNAIRYPCLLIPIPKGQSLFRTTLNYTPGDKFRVSYGDGYMLIETFKGEDEK